jgi:lambda family phage portal protein
VRFSLLERAIEALAPGWAASRALNRARAAACDDAYEAARASRLRRMGAGNGSGNAAIVTAGPILRAEARRLERNHDLARGALDVLEQNVVGAGGIGVEPQPMTMNGEVHADLAWEIRELWADWCLTPEASHSHDYASTQRLQARTWFRDGEVLQQMLTGYVPGLDHGTRVPFSIELIEPDLLDWDFNDVERRITHGVERNAWNRPTGYHVFLQHPGDPGVYQPARKRLPAAVVRHLKRIDRIGQTRGISVFAPVLTRLADLKEYEESERIAAKVAASMAAYIKRGTPDMYGATEGEGSAPGAHIPPPQHFAPGMFFELNVGEEIGTINTSRPNVGLEAFRNGQLRATAAGLRLSFSALARQYDGTYSAQRQELVDQWGVFALLSAEFTHQCVRPTYRQFVTAAVLSGVIKLPGDVDPQTIASALFVPQAMPWIDPEKEANAMEILERNNYISAQEIIRRRGGNPAEVLRARQAWQRSLTEHGLTDTKPKGPAQ